MTIDDRIAQLRRWDAAYYGDKAEVSDAVYDAERDAVRALVPDHLYFKAVGAPAASAWPKVKHRVPMGSLFKVQTEDELRRWLPGGPYFVSHKLDGISISLRYEQGVLVRAVTRGDGEVGEDITPNVRKMDGLPQEVQFFKGYVRSEIVLRRSVFEAVFKPLGYKNCRNAAGGAAKDLAGTMCAHLTVVSYNILPDDGSLNTRWDEFALLRTLGFRTPGCRCGVPVADVLAFYQEHVDGARDRLDYDIDGLVVEVDNTSAREALGETDGRPHGARAFKFPHETAETRLQNIEWQVGASGRITPVAIFDAVELGGATVARATLHNISYIQGIAGRGASCNYLCEGDVIRVSRRNDVIPAVETVVAPVNFGAKMFSSPIACPACDTALVMVGEYLTCPNMAGCEAQTAGGIKRWLSKVGVKEFGDALVEAACGVGSVKEPADLYELRVEDVAALQLSGRRVGLATARTAIENLRAKMALPLHVLVGSLGIPLWSRSMVKILVAAGCDSIEKMESATAIDLARIEGVGEVKARAFVDGFTEVLPKIRNLLAAGVSIAPEATGSLAGKSVCMTGFRDAKMEAAVEAAGGTVKSSVVRGLTYLVAKDSNGTSGKLEKARAAGTKVLSIGEMWELLKK